MAEDRAAELLREFAELKERKAGEYGNTVEMYGRVMKGLFPDGIMLRSRKDHELYGLFSMMVHKMVRQAVALSKDSSNPDHSRDLSVYAAMFNEKLPK